MGIIKRKSKEHTEQTKFVQYVRVIYPEIMCWSIPNGAGTSASNRLHLSHEGLLAGMPDLMLMLPGPRVLALEFKRPDGTGRLSEAQNRAIERLKTIGCTVGVVESFDAAKAVLSDWMVSGN